MAIKFGHLPIGTRYMPSSKARNCLMSVEKRTKMSVQMSEEMSEETRETPKKTSKKTPKKTPKDIVFAKSWWLLGDNRKIVRNEARNKNVPYFFYG